MKRLVSILIVSCFLLVSLTGCIDDTSGQEKNTNLADLRDAAAALIAGDDAPITTKMAEEQDDVLVYRYYAPESTEKLPLILYFHGAGVTGDDNTSHITRGGEPACFVTDVFQDITPELEHRKSGYVERKRRPYQGNVVRIE